MTDARRIIKMDKKFYITVSDIACYPIKAKDKEEAIRKAWEWFYERTPDFKIEEVERFDGEEE